MPRKKTTTPKMRTSKTTEEQTPTSSDTPTQSVPKEKSEIDDAMDILEQASEAPDVTGMSESDPVPEPEAPLEQGQDSPEENTEPVPVPEPEADTAEVGSVDVSDNIAPEIATNVMDPLEAKRFQGLLQVASELTVSKAEIFLGKLTQPKQLGRISNWQTDRRHLIAQDAMDLCKEPEFLRTYWPYVKFLMGRDLGLGQSEIWIYLGLAIQVSLHKEYEKKLAAILS